MSALTNEKPPDSTTPRLAKRAVSQIFVTIRRIKYDISTRAVREIVTVMDGDKEMADWLNSTGYEMMHFNLTHSSYDMPQNEDEKKKGWVCRQLEIVTEAIANAGIVEIPRQAPQPEPEPEPPAADEEPDKAEPVPDAPKTYNVDEVNEIVRQVMAGMQAKRFQDSQTPAAE